MQCPSRPGLVAAPGREGERLSLLGAAVLEVRVGEVGLEVVFLAFFVLVALVVPLAVVVLGLVAVLGLSQLVPRPRTPARAARDLSR